MAGGHAPPPKQEELLPHPAKDQLPNIAYCITSPPPWPEAILLGFQHYLVMLGTTVLIPTTLVPQMGGGNEEKAKMIQTLLFVAGVNTLMQTLFGSRLPAVIGASYTFVPTTLSIVLAGRYSDLVDPGEKFEKIMRGTQGALIVASTLQIVLGFSGLWRNVMRFMSPLSVVPLVSLAGFGLYEFGFPLLTKCVEIGLPQLIILVIFSQVWQEFWITGDVDGRGDPISNPNGPLDHDLFMFCARDTVKLLRNHPSLALWVGGNEQVPLDDINTALKNDLKLYPYFQKLNESGNSTQELSPVLKDPSQYLDGTHIYIQGSMWDGFANGKGDFTDGPYEIQNPENFFKDDFYMYGFNPEVGSVGMPVAATIRATMPPEGWQIPVFIKLSNGYVKEVPNPIWDYHKYIPYSKPNLVHDQILQYGTTKDLDDFCLKAQLVNYIQYRALLEGLNSRMWSKYTGVLI